MDLSFVDKHTALVCMEGQMFVKHLIVNISFHKIQHFCKLLIKLNKIPPIVSFISFSTKSTQLLNVFVTLLQIVAICFLFAFVACHSSPGRVGENSGCDVANKRYFAGCSNYANHNRWMCNTRHQPPFLMY